MIVGILKDLNFRSTTLTSEICIVETGGELVLICRQVDDFAVASVTRATASTVVTARIRKTGLARVVCSD
jgi:hypothetical protein